MAGLLYADSLRVTDFVQIRIPTVGEIMDNEEAFNEMVSVVVSTPYELMVPLDDIGVNFDEVSHFDVFCMLFTKLQTQDVSLLFGDTDFSGYKYAIRNDTNEGEWFDERTGSRIDRLVHVQMCAALRKVLQISVNDKKPGNEEARKYMLDRARRKAKRRKKENTSQLESYIIALVNSRDFKYDYHTVRNITIYQFYQSLQQISHKIQFDNTMIGYYTGSIKFDDISQQNKSWILTTTN